MADEPFRSGETTEPPDIGRFVGDPTRRIEDWTWLWEGDHRFPVQTERRGPFGRLLVFVKRLLRPLFKAPLSDLWDRQRVFNLILIEWVGRNLAQHDDLHRHVHQIHKDHQDAIEAHAARLVELDRRTTEAMTEVMRHNDALFSRVDQKLDRYRREAKTLWHRLGALIATADRSASGSQDGETVSAKAAEIQRQQSYLDLELRYRGSEEDIAERISAYLPHLAGRQTLLDLGCGRGEALTLFREHGIDARGIDSNTEMIRRCQDKGLPVEEAEIFTHLEGLEEGGLDAIVSFHVIEHLPPESVDRLVRLAWRALASSGVLILETPSPLSVVTASRNFWIDPTHQRPVHPAGLEVTFREAGFEPVSRVDLHPFPASERLPEIPLDTVPDAQRDLADQVNRMRDLIDDLLFGHRDFAMIGIKP